MDGCRCVSPPLVDRLLELDSDRVHRFTLYHTLRLETRLGVVRLRDNERSLLSVTGDLDPRLPSRCLPSTCCRSETPVSPLAAQAAPCFSTPEQKTIDIDGEDDDVAILARERWPSLEYDILDSEPVRDCVDAGVGLDRN